MNMNNWTLLSTVKVFYQPQSGQKFRCSENFQGWDTPSGGRLKFKVVTKEGYPQPTFAITHDKAGPDKRWYSDLSDGAIIPVASGQGGAGKTKVYVGTTSHFPDGSGYQGSESYLVEVWLEHNG